MIIQAVNSLIGVVKIMAGRKLVLAVETSCDETSAAIVAEGTDVLSSIVSSQVKVHRKYGGVVPEIASRKHMENIIPVVEAAFKQADCTPEDIEVIGVTYGPGLVGALLVGLSFAKAAAYAIGVPLVGVNHLAGHLYAGFLAQPGVNFPIICLIVSGGHTSLVYMSGHGQFEIMGETRDDAAGEVLDKVARTMGLEYPGGPRIEALAAEGDPAVYDFPRAWLEEGSLDFSYSGLKSAVINFLHNEEQRGREVNLDDAAAGFQEAVLDVLVEKTAAAVKQRPVDSVMLVGGVAANMRLRLLLGDRLAAENVCLIVPSPELCTDNAAMIGCAAYYQFVNGQESDLYLNAVPNLTFGFEKEKNKI